MCVMKIRTGKLVSLLILFLQFVESLEDHPPVTTYQVGWSSKEMIAQKPIEIHRNPTVHDRLEPLPIQVYNPGQNGKNRGVGKKPST